LKYFKYQSINGNKVAIKISKNIKRYISLKGGVILLIDKDLKSCATDKDKKTLAELLIKGWISVEKETLLADELTFKSNNGITWKVRVVGENELPVREEYWSNY
jgi:hypothetical protein